MKVNLKLLKRLYLIDHESCKEHDMVSFILNYCYKIPHLTFSIDKEWTILILSNIDCGVISHRNGVVDCSWFGDGDVKYHIEMV